MATYIDAAFYNDTYGGQPVADPAELERLIKRASEHVDQASGFAILQTGFNTLPAIVQERIKKAAAAQVEYLANGGGQSVAQFSIGKFQASGAAGPKYGPDMVEHLRDSGFIFAGVLSL